MPLRASRRVLLDLVGSAARLLSDWLRIEDAIPPFGQHPAERVGQPDDEEVKAVIDRYPTLSFAFGSRKDGPRLMLYLGSAVEARE